MVLLASQGIKCKWAEWCGEMNKVDGSKFSRYITDGVWGGVDLTDVACNDVGWIQPVQESIKCRPLQLKVIRI